MTSRIRLDDEHESSKEQQKESRGLIRQPARDPRDEVPPPTKSRPASPYTLKPPIDYDGLSWPSKLHDFMVAIVDQFFRRWNP